MTVRRKYGNKKLTVDGVQFDSKLEYYCYGYLKLVGVDFEFQKKIVLVEKFRFNGKAIRELAMVVDFVIHHNGQEIYLDTKGFPTEKSIIKYKLLRNWLKDRENTDVVWLKTKKEVNSFINNLIK